MAHQLRAANIPERSYQLVNGHKAIIRFSCYYYHYRDFRTHDHFISSVPAGLICFEYPV